MPLKLRHRERCGIEAQYVLTKEVGSGGFGVVYKALDESLERTVAIKVLDSGSSDDTRRRFDDEAGKLAVCAHENIVTVHGKGMYRGQPFFVMEYLPTSFAKYIDNEGSHSLYDDVAPMLKDVLRGLAFLHDKSWTHRDIKPSNVLLTPERRAKIADFGLVKDPCLSLTGSGDVMGTPRYMAPEQEEGEVSPATDVYSFGLVAYRALVGGLPKDDHTKDRQKEFRWPRLQDLLSSCLEEQPAHRPQHARDVLNRWVEIDDKGRPRSTRRRVRSDASVGKTVEKIEGEYGLPRGSVRLFGPRTKRPISEDDTIATVRKQWGE